MFGSILHRMILWELIKVFVLSLVGLTGLLLLAGIIAEAAQRGLGPMQILQLIPLIIPSTLPYTIPTTTLFATSLVYGRLAADSEIIAIKSAGIPIRYVVGPCLLLGLVMSGVTLGLYIHLIPWTQNVMRNIVLKDLEELLYNMLRNERCINHPKMSYAIWVKKVQGRRLIDPVFKRRDGKGGYDLVAQASEAELHYDLQKGVLLLHMRHGEVLSDPSETRAYFDDRIWDVPVKESPLMAPRPRRANELTWLEIHERLQELAVEGKQAGDDITAVQELAKLPKPPEGLKQHLAHLYMRAHILTKESYSLRAELQLRPAIALGCLCFVLVGCPVGIWFSRSDYLSSFITCFLPIVFIYYPILLCGTNLGRDARINPAFTIWIADLLLILVSIPLYRRLQRN